ncbi:MAG: hypothetical protein VYB73_07165 [Verrucomicrobiota bacterium]|nr:hypothetical protein [Verrucomicrobiota bacterium]
MLEPSSENKPEQDDLFSGEEENLSEEESALGINFVENWDPLIIRKSKKSEIENSQNDTEEVNIYRGKGSSSEDSNTTSGELIESHGPNVIAEQLNDVEKFNLSADITSSADLPVGLVLEPLYQKEKNTFKVKAAVCIAVSSFVLIIFLLWSGKISKTGGSGADLQGLSNNSKKHLLKPLVPIEGEDLAGTKLRIDDTLKKFFQAGGKEELYGVIRKSENVLDHLTDYYSRNEFSFPNLNSIDSMLKFEDPPNFWIANITVQDEIRARSVILEDTDTGFLVDWEEFVRYSPMGWEDFIDEKGQEAINFRVRATLDVNPGFAFPDREKWICVRIDDWKSDDILFGYVMTGTELSKRIQKLLYDEWQKDCVLRLQFPEDPKGGINQVNILDLINGSWVRFD